MPIRLIDKDLSRISYDAEIRTLRIRCEQNIIRSFENEKIVYLVRPPKWKDGKHGEAELLTSQYAEVLKQAENDKCQSIVLPLELQPRTFPRDKIYSIVVEAVNKYLIDSDLTVYIKISNAKTFKSGFDLKDKLQKYISKVYIPLFERERSGGWFKFGKSITSVQKRIDIGGRIRKDGHSHSEIQSINDILNEEHKGHIQLPEGLQKRLKKALEEKQPEETFTEMVLRLIDEKGMTDPQCYKKANMDKRLFSKIRCNAKYHPEKETAILLALALELNKEDTGKLLRKAGYALSPIYERDVIVEFFISEKRYNVMDIDGVLYEKGLKLLSNYDPELNSSKQDYAAEVIQCRLD